VIDQVRHPDERAPKPLSVPEVPHRHFGRNFIKNAVCELRFPTLHEINQPVPPLKFAAALRREYPHQAHLAGVDVAAPILQRSSGHIFKSKKDRWTISLKPAVLSLETNQYSTFEEFEKRIADVIEAAKTFVDSDFFTRVGIRYVNAFPYERQTVSKWINPDLVRPLSIDAFGDAHECAQQIRGSTVGGNYLFQHGLGAEGSATVYVIDLDFYSEDLPIADTMAAVRGLHKRLFDLFMWAIGPAATAALEGRPDAR
jgi:uncharacterized protein (TIGR04255 family)